jgi:hypothetical protein
VPADRRLAEGLATTMADLYGGAAERLAVDVARRLDRDLAGAGIPDRPERRLLAAQALTEQSRRLVARLDTAMATQVEQMVLLAQQRGSAEALRELGRLGFALPSTSAGIRQALPGAEAAQRLIFSLASTLRGTHLRITRWPADIYRQVIARADVDVLLGTATRRQAAQRAWQDLVGRGVTGFVDRAGRGWALESYVDMASRTVAAQAAVEAHLDRLAEAGLDLVIVSDAPGECPKCRDWEGKVLTRDGGGARTVEVEHATRDGEMIQVRVAGSVDDAVRGGLFHPSCRHSLSAYQPGVTQAPTHTADPEGDQARQRLRRLERGVRRDKLIGETALTDAARLAAAARVRAGQGRIRDHVAQTGLLRQRHREQLRLGHTPPPAGRATPRPTPPPAPPPAPAPALPPRATLGTPSLPIPRPASTLRLEPVSRRELARIQGRRDVERLQAQLRRLPADDPGRARIEFLLGDARERVAQQKPGGGGYNWDSPYWDDPAAQRIAGAPTAADLREHLHGRLGSGRGVPADLRAELETELVRQSELTPRSILEFAGLEDFDVAGHPNAYAYYRSSGRQVAVHPRWVTHRGDSDRSVRADIAAGFHPPTGRSPLDSVVAHEYGHHLAYRLLRESPLARQRELVSLLDDTFAADGYLVRQFRANPDFAQVLDDYLRLYGTGRVDRLVSRYGRNSHQELLAEIWSEYSTMGDAARPHIRAIGDMMRQMAEASEVILTV